MNPKSGNWTVLTNQKNAGIVDHISWSKDGSKIYFERHMGAPLGVYTIPALGGEPRLLLEAAQEPEALPDGSLIVTRTNAERRTQLYRFTPDTGTLQPLNAVLDGPAINFAAAGFRAFPDGTEIVFYGEPQDAASEAGLRILDLKTNRSRPFGPKLPEALTSFGIGINSSDGSVVMNTSAGDVHQVLAIPRKGNGEAKVLLTLTDKSGFVDVAPDGSLYVDQVSRPVQVLRLAESGQELEQLALVTTARPGVLELPSERFLLTAMFEGRPRLVVVKPTGDVVPFIETELETHGPATLVGANQVAFIIGNPAQSAIAIASIADGRVIQRISLPPGKNIQSLASSSDGSTLFYADGSIWSLPIAGGEERKLGPGDLVAFDPSSKTLVVQLNTESGVRLVRMQTSGGSQEPIPMESEFRIPPFQTHAVRADGQIAIPIASRDSWFYGIGLLDPSTGKIKRVPLRYDEDIFSLSWNAQNKIVTGGALFRSSIWRFRPEPAH
jgi:Tol biopolymer transport system component